MFAPPVSKPKAKTASNDLTAFRSARPFGQRNGDAEHSTVFWHLPRGAADVNAKDMPPRLAWSFREVPVFSPGREEPFQMPPEPRLPVQAKLEVGAVDDPLEHEADRVADQVVRTPGPGISTVAAQPQISRECTSCEEAEKSPAKLAGPEAAGQAPSIVHDALRSPGQPLDRSVRGFFEPRFGHDFSQVRIHVGTAAAAAAGAVKGRAFTSGSSIAFGRGQYAPSTVKGQHLLAHELTHVLQQRQASQPALQRAPLSDFQDADPKHDPSLLTDAQIKATDDYKDLTTKIHPPRKAPVPQNIALLAVRLRLRSMREVVGPIQDAASFLPQAEKQAGTLAETEKQVGHLQWAPFNTGAAVSNPSALPTEFGRWVLAGGPMPDKMSGVINCWEMVLFGAFKAGFITFARIQKIYNDAVANVKSGKATLVGDTVEAELRGTAEQIFDPKNPDSPAPLPGDVVIFNKAATHVTISTGTVKGGKHEVISLWNQPGAISTVQRTSIEDLLAVTGASGQPVKFWSANW
jgi:hypothetical protein